jgi:hypothetical protein
LSVKDVIAIVFWIACGTPDTRDRKPCDKCKRKRKGINYCINLGHARPSEDGE